MWWSEWWAWAIFGLILAILEVLVPGAIFLGFAAGAGSLALLLAVGGSLARLIAVSLPFLLLAFAILSLTAWLIFRRVFRLKDRSVEIYREDIND
jgi:membrane protein implicated in regulation of membrane protease activity